MSSRSGIRLRTGTQHRRKQILKSRREVGMTGQHQRAEESEPDFALQGTPEGGMSGWTVGP